MNLENTKPSKYKRYDEAFKRSAVELWLQAMSAEHPIHLLCATLDVSASGYHAWTQRVPSLRARVSIYWIPMSNPITDSLKNEAQQTGCFTGG